MKGTLNYRKEQLLGLLQAVLSRTALRLADRFQ